MKAKKPTLSQKKALRAAGLQPDAWLIVSDSGKRLQVVARTELARCRMRRVEGVAARPRIRTIEKEGI